MTRTLVPPDGGYGWVIVFASVLNNVSKLLKAAFQFQNTLSLL